jgi:hypothetical protein
MLVPKIQNQHTFFLKICRYILNREICKMKTLKIGIHQNPELEQDLTSLKAQDLA